MSRPLKIVLWAAFWLFLGAGVMVGYLYSGLLVNSYRYTHSRLPQLARSNLTNIDALKQEFAERVKNKFPPGTAESSVIAALVGDGFKLSASPRKAFFARIGGACRNDWYISWNTNDYGVITAISGELVVVCL